MKERIQERLREIEIDKGFRILYACESGSRAWGFASQDSDYDVRFIYCWQPDDYLSIYSPIDQIDLGVDAENLDFSGWDIRKALPLFRKSNGALMEWLHSPIVYYENPKIMSDWRQLVSDYFVCRATSAHYLGLCQQMWLKTKENEHPTAKKYLYLLRSLLSARYIGLHQKPVPVEFATLLNEVPPPDNVRNEVITMIAHKANKKEQDTIERNKIIDQFISSELEELQNNLPNLPAKQGDENQLNAFFRQTITH